MDDHQPKEDVTDGPAMPTQADLEAMFDADDADVESGLVVAATPVLAQMRATAARIRRERVANKAALRNV